MTPLPQIYAEFSFLSILFSSPLTLNLLFKIHFKYYFFHEDFLFPISDCILMPCRTPNYVALKIFCLDTESFVH